MGLQLRQKSTRTIRTLTILMAVFALVAQPLYGVITPNVSAATVVSETVSGDTAEWMFNRDTSTSTPYTFTNDAVKTGPGSLYVKPIGANPKDKFIAEYFAKTAVKDFKWVKYDFKIAGNGTGADSDNFYLNVYATIDNSNEYYDCRFDYVPKVAAAKTRTATFNANATPVHVQKRGSRIAECPTTLKEMPAGSYVRALAINVGDTTASDQGLAGYLDNVQVRKATTTYAYDFAPLSAPTLVAPANDATVNGKVLVNSWEPVAGAAKYVYESYNDAAMTQKRWTETTTKTSKSATNVAHGTVFWWRVKAVDAKGVAESDWSSPYKVTIDNVGPTQPVLSVKDSNGDDIASGGTTKSYSVTTYWSNVGAANYQYFYWNNIPNDPYNSEAKAWAPMVGQTTSRTGEFTQGEGTHYIKVCAFDLAGNKTCSDPYTIVYKKDIEAPSVPVNGAPNDELLKTNEFDFTWNESTDNEAGDLKYEFRSSQDKTKVGDAPDGSGAWESGELSSPKIHSSGAGDGIWYWQVRAIDATGNKSAWSEVWDMAIDTKNPTLELVQPQEGEVFGAVDKKTIRVEAKLYDEQGLGSYNIKIDEMDAETTDDADATVAAETYPGPVSLTVIAQLNSDDFADGEHTITITITDKAGNVTTETRKIVVANAVVVPGGGNVGGQPQGNSDDGDELQERTDRLNRPFPLPNSFGIVPTPELVSQGDKEVLGAQKTPDVDGAAKNVAAIPTEEGWKLFGMLWYWWLLLAAVIAAISAWLIAAAKRRAADNA